MPLFQYLSWVGGFLFAALFAANWCVSAPMAPAQRSAPPAKLRSGKPRQLRKAPHLKIARG
jgi:hypothetical protein